MDRSLNHLNDPKREGYPLSRYLFSLDTEPLASVIRTRVSIQDVEIAGDQHVISLYAEYI
jgi:hypothetical protein